MRAKLLAIAGLVGLGIAGRLIPHLPNATPMTAITLAAGKHLGRASAVLIPLAVMLISDAVIGFYDWRILVSVYASFACISVLSILARKYPRAIPTGLVLISASLLFFLVTNFSVWLFSPWYEKSIEGLMYAYTLGLPFLRNMLLGDIAYGLVLFGALEIVRVLRTKKQALQSA